MSSTQSLRQRPAGQKTHSAGAQPSEAEKLQDLAAKLAKSPAFLLALQEAVEEQQHSPAAALDLARKLFPDGVKFEIDHKESALRVWLPPHADYAAAFELSLDRQEDFDRFGLQLLPMPT
jgi:hypothetical protein